MLEETKQRQRLQQEARTIAKLDQLEIEICEKLSGELECSMSFVFCLLSFVFCLLSFVFTLILLGSIHSIRVKYRYRDRGKAPTLVSHRNAQLRGENVPPPPFCAQDGVMHCRLGWGACKNIGATG